LLGHIVRVVILQATLSTICALLHFLDDLIFHLELRAATYPPGILCVEAHHLNSDCRLKGKISLAISHILKALEQENCKSTRMWSLLTRLLMSKILSPACPSSSHLQNLVFRGDVIVLIQTVVPKTVNRWDRFHLGRSSGHSRYRGRLWVHGERFPNSWENHLVGDSVEFDSRLSRRQSGTPFICNHITAHSTL